MSSIKKELISGVFYMILSKYSRIIISLVVAGVLARLIAPQDFGIVAIATVIISFFNIFSDLGIGPAIIQNKNLTSDNYSQIFSFTIWQGLILAALFFLSSWFIAGFYNSPILKTICQLLSVNLFFASINIVPKALLYKNKEFQFIAYRSLITQVLGGSIAVTAALMGAGLYALIINPILSSIFLFILSYWKYPQKMHLTWGMESIRKIFSFSAYQFLFNVINYFSRNMDKLLIGKYMNLTQLGYYEKSYRLMMLPLQNITYVISPVMHPIFSEFQNDPIKLAGHYEKVVRFLAFIGLPLSVFLWFDAKEITLFVFGDQWFPSIPVFQILTLSVGIQVIFSTSGSIFQAANDTKSLFICGIFATILNVSGMLIGIFIFKSLNAIAWCICITFAINFIQCYWWMYKYTFKQNILSFWKQFFAPLKISILIGICLYGTSLIVDEYPIIVSLIIKGTLYIGMLTGYLQLSGEYDIWKLIKSKIRK